MQEQNFIPERPRRSDRLVPASVRTRGAAAAAASATGAALFALVLAVLPPLPGAAFMTAIVDSPVAAAVA